MICGKCNNSVPDNFAFCPYCGQKIEAPAPAEPVRPVETPVIARSAMPKEEEYAGRYESGDMPEPAIRFSKNLSAKQQAPIQTQQPAEPVEQKPAEPVQVEEPAQPKCAACGAPLREGAKFCNTCGQAVQKAEPPKAEEPAAPVAPPVEQKPAEPVQVEEPAQPKCAACGAPLREDAKFCNTCGQAVQKAEPPKAEEPAAPVAPPVEQKPAEPVQVEEPAQPKCAACGAPLREDAKFCNICGQAIVKAEEKPVAPVVPPMQQKPAEPVIPPAQQKPAEPVIPPAQQKPIATFEQKPAAPVQRPALKKCPLCGTVVPAEAKLCTGCGVAFRVQEAARQQPVAPVQPAAPVKQKKAKASKKSKAPLVIALVLVLALVGVLVAGLLTNWFGLASPVANVYDATEKTLRAGGFHAEFTVSVPGEMEFEGTADCVLDIEARELTALVELEYQGETGRMGIYEGKAIMQDPDGNSYSMDIDYILDPIFDELEEDMSMDEALEKAIDLVLDSTGMGGMLDADETFKGVSKSLNSTAWLKENAGYSTESDGGVKLHVFEPKLGDLAVAAVEALESAFDDEDDFEEGLDYLKEYKSNLNDMADIELVFGVQSGKLVQLSGEFTIDGETAVVEISFEDIGSADVDTDALEEMLDSGDKPSADSAEPAVESVG